MSLNIFCVYSSRFRKSMLTLSGNKVTALSFLAGCSPVARNIWKWRTQSLLDAYLEEEQNEET